jgi:hypothetical protein
MDQTLKSPVIVSLELIRTQACTISNRYAFNQPDDGMGWEATDFIIHRIVRHILRMSPSPTLSSAGFHILI